MAEWRFRGGRVRRIAFDGCDGWSLRDGAIRHDSGRYFSLVLVEDADGREHLLIDQPEVGLLAFALRRRGDGVEWLLQDKVEPGNLGGFQWAPSVQATRSNFERVHGGRATPLLDEVLQAREVMVDVEQSEQGGLFLGKFNRNRKVVLEDGGIAVPAGWAWTSAAALRALLREDARVNTDARSVIACGAWAMLGDPGRPLFDGGVLPARLAGAFARSYADASEARIEAACALLDAEGARRSSRPGPRRRAIEEGRTHQLTPMAIVDAGGRPVAGFFEAWLPTREVEHWCQPLLLREAVAVHALLFSLRGDQAWFRVGAWPEVGFGARVEFGPTLQSGQGPAGGSVDTLRARLADAAVVHVLHQSDEGGRFFQQRGDYVLAEADPDQAEADASPGAWLTLGDLERLATRRGRLSNELRTLLSLVLGFA